MKKYPPDAVCSRPDCNERPYARSLCSRHYGRWLYHRDWMDEPPRHRAVNIGRKCPHCPGRAVKRGYCEKHYGRMFRRSTLSQVGFWDQVRAGQEGRFRVMFDDA